MDDAGAVTLLIIDMQVGAFRSPHTQHDAEGVIARINRLAATVRDLPGTVVFIQDDGRIGGAYEPGTRGWELLPELIRTERDLVVHKRACDAFYETSLKAELDRLGTRELLITGSATEYCVDTTVRAAASLDYQVTVVSDGHTMEPRSHLPPDAIREHHNLVWAGLSLPRAVVRVEPADAVIARLRASAHNPEVSR